MKYTLKAIDTFKFGSEAITIAEFDDRESALKALEEKNGSKDELSGTSFYKYFLVDPGGLRVEDE